MECREYMPNGLLNQCRNREDLQYKPHLGCICFSVYCFWAGFFGWLFMLALLIVIVVPLIVCTLIRVPNFRSVAPKRQTFRSWPLGAAGTQTVEAQENGIFKWRLTVCRNKSHTHTHIGIITAAISTPSSLSLKTMRIIRLHF